VLGAAQIPQRLLTVLSCSRSFVNRAWSDETRGIPNAIVDSVASMLVKHCRTQWNALREIQMKYTSALTIYKASIILLKYVYMHLPYLLHTGSSSSRCVIDNVDITERTRPNIENSVRDITSHQPENNHSHAQILRSWVSFCKRISAVKSTQVQKTNRHSSQKQWCTSWTSSILN
jgi:hypothetical protein